MMQANDFDGNAAFSGGGFMSSESTQTVADRPSSSFKNNDARCLIPLTVKQLKDLSSGGESGVCIDGVDVNNIVLVGMVSKIDNAVTDCTFRVDDGTGWVECTKWIHEHVDSAEVDVISVGMYVRVYGQLKSIQSRRTLHTFSIRPLTDFNEVANHFTECIYVHLYNTKLRGSMNNQPQATNFTGGMTTQPLVTNSFGSSPIKGFQTNPSNQFSGQYNTTEEQMGSLSSMVLNFLRRPTWRESEMGVSSDIVARELNISLDKIRKVLEHLSEEGAIYTTIDDHYKLIDV